MVAITLRLLAIKINIALEININSSSSADRGKGNTLATSKLFQHFTIKVTTFHFKLAD